MRLAALFPHLSGLSIQDVRAGDGQLTLTVAARRHTASCPHCRRRSRRIHSQYWRHPRDMPINGLRVTLHLRVRRFFCVNPRCPHRTFAERFPALLAPYARRTHTLNDWLTHVAFALGGEAGAQLLHHLGVTICGDTLLARIRAFTFADPPVPRILSVDDFAFRRGRIYGSILVDLERHCTIDLLPDRSTGTFATWLLAHPGVAVVSRDRSGEYAEGARQGAPNAIHTAHRAPADRFHLLRNLHDVVLRVFKRHARRLAQIAAPGATHQTLTRLRLDREASKAQTRGEMHARFTDIHHLASTGMHRSAIARELGVHRHTVQKYLAYDHPPERPHSTRKTSILASYEGYLLAQWHGGRHNAMQLWREIVAQGYTGSYRNVSRLTGYLRRQERTGCVMPPSPAGLSPTQAAGILVHRPENRTDEEQEALARLPALHPELAAVVARWESFADMFRDRDDEYPGCRLERWMSATTETNVPELKAFVTKLRQDVAAVVAALTLPYSQGQTEGRVNRLKLIKRSMYGRAKFDLLRQRAMYASTS
jgi:transposase